MGAYAVYIHLPFCKTRCVYCDFYSTVTDAVPFERYGRAVIAEWKRRLAGAPHLERISSVYIGGGTPSLWSVDALGMLLAAFSLQGDEEVTVEVNPKDGDEKWFAALVGAGVTRFSIGVQSMDPLRLSFLGRRHSVEDASRAVRAAVSSGAQSVSADLIFGTPGHQVDGWSRELEDLVSLGVHHVSAYQLTIAESTPLFAKQERGETVSTDEDGAARLYRTVRILLAKRGFKQYEVSNFAPRQYQSKHNLHYWRGGEYMGLGAGAHGFVRTQDRLCRTANCDDVERYMGAALSGEAPLATHLGEGGFTENLSQTDHARERLMLGLRTTNGAPFEAILASVPPEVQKVWQKAAASLALNKLVRLKNGHIVPTAAGLIRADGIAECFF